MANMFFTAALAEAAQVDTATPSNITTADVAKITAADNLGNESSIEFTVGATETAQAVVEGLKAAADAAKADGIKPWDDITATEDDSILTLTVDTAGKPMDYTDDSTGMTLTIESDTASSGPSDWELQGNWFGGDADLPGADASDAVYVDGGNEAAGSPGASVLYGLDQSAIANALSRLELARCVAGHNPDLGKAPQYLQIKTAIAEINKPAGVGTQTLQAPINLDFGSVTAAQVTVHNTGTNPVASEPGVNLLAGHASTDLFIKAGNVGIAGHSGETATVGDINVEGGTVLIGSGVTLTNLFTKGGTCTCRCGMTTADITKGTVTLEGSGSISAALIVRGGIVYCNSSGTIAELDILGGIVDFTKSNVPRTVTLLKIAAGAVVKYDPSIVTITAMQIYDAAGNITITVSK